MAHGEKYKYYFMYGYGNTTEYKVSFKFDGYAGIVTTLQAGNSPYVLSVDAQEDSIDSPIFPTNVKLEFLVESSIATYDTDFLESDTGEIIVEVIKDPNGTPVAEWVGIVKPELCWRAFQEYKYIYKISAIDGLAELKNFYYTSDGTETGSIYSGFEDLLTIIKTAISKVATATELQLDFRIQCGLYSTLMSSTECAYKENEVPQEMFFRYNNGVTQPDTCYDVLSKLCGSPIYTFLTQYGGYYWIIYNPELNSYYFEYDWSTLTQQARTANNRNFFLYGPSSQIAGLIDKGTLYKQPGYGYLDLNLRNKFYATNLITNGEFTDNITGWTNGDSDDSSNTFTTLSYTNDPGTGGVIDATYGGSATAGFYNFHTTSAITLPDIGVSAGAITIQYKVKWNTGTPASTSAPKVQVRLYNATDGYTNSQEGQRTLTIKGDYYIFEDTFADTDIQNLTVANNYLDIQVEITDATTTGAEFYFDYFRMGQLDETDPKDWLVKNSLASPAHSKKKSVEIFIADQRESPNDIFSIRDASGTYTSGWNRYGKTNGYSLTYTFANDWFKDNYKPMDYVRASFYDEDNEMNHTQLYYDNTFTAKYYKVIAFEKNFSTAEVMVQLKEVKTLTDSDQTVYADGYKQTTSYD